MERSLCYRIKVFIVQGSVKTLNFETSSIVRFYIGLELYPFVASPFCWVAKVSMKMILILLSLAQF